MPQHPNNPDVTIKCPCCGSEEVTRGRDSYVVVGDAVVVGLDDEDNEYEEEMEITEYDCGKCLMTFFL